MFSFPTKDCFYSELLCTFTLLISYLEDQVIRVVLVGLVIHLCREVLEALGAEGLRCLHVSAAAWQHLTVSLRGKNNQSGC